jgi:Family of unknown function (DUF6502)
MVGKTRSNPPAPASQVGAEPAPQAPTTGHEAALLHALDRLLQPLSRLAVGQGLPFQVVEEMLKRGFVRAARESRPTLSARDISRVAIATGLNRREVTRLSNAAAAAGAERTSPATQIFTRWRSDRTYLDDAGQPQVLRRQGAAPSFETLAQAVTRDVHPRSLLEELCRLGLARHDTDNDTVVVLQESFVPRDDLPRLYGFLGSNVGDHMAASVANVLGKERRHFEQAVFADELSPASLEAADRLVRAQWRALMAAVVPELEALIAADRAAAQRDPNLRPNQRLRIGLYAYDAPMVDTDPQETPKK